MNINYNYYNKQLLINQLVEQTKFNLARLTNLENIVNKLVKSDGLDNLVIIWLMGIICLMVMI